MLFLKELEKNNTKVWFDENRPAYDASRSAFITLVQDWIDAVIANEPSLEGQSAKTSVFRINRDVRFSTNKNPYKTNFSAYLAKGGKKYPGAGFYLHIDPKGSFLACGIWMPPAPVLQAIRQEIDYNLDEYESILKELNNKGVYDEMSSDRLSRPPKGYEPNNPALEHLKQKSFVRAIQLDEALLKDQDVVQKLTKHCLQLNAYAAFLNRAVDALELN